MAAPDGDFIELLSTDEADADMTTGRIYFGATPNQTYHYDDCTFNVAETTQVTMDEDHAVTAVYLWDGAELAANGGTLYDDFDGLDDNHDEEIELSEAGLTQGEFNDLLRAFDTDSDDRIDLSEARAAARLRIASDLGVFLNAIGYSYDPYAADYNELDYDQDEEGNPIDVFGPNGIPDWAEFALIDALVQDPSVDFTAYSGVGGEFVKAAFEDNLAQAEIDLSGLDAAIQRTVAYYMTLCNSGSRNFAMDMVYNAWEISLDETDYACAGSEYLQPYGNADNDGLFNIEEWTASEGNLSDYLDDTLNGSP